MLLTLLFPSYSMINLGLMNSFRISLLLATIWPVCQWMSGIHFSFFHLFSALIKLLFTPLTFSIFRRIGKLMLFGAIFRCLDSALTIAAVLSFRSPFVSWDSVDISFKFSYICFLSPYMLCTVVLNFSRLLLLINELRLTKRSWILLWETAIIWQCWKLTRSVFLW